MRPKPDKKLPVKCPACSSQLEVTELGCNMCETKISGSFPLPALSKLTAEEQHFILEFIKSSGSLKLMAQQFKLSYPTVRNMLDDLIEKVKSAQ